MRLLIALLALVTLPTASFAHDTMIRQCALDLVKNVTKLYEEVLPNGMLAEVYSLNGSDKESVATISVVLGTDDKTIQHQPYPILYWIDDDGDSKPDYVMIDKNGDGICESIVLYTGRTEGLPPMRGSGVNE